MSTGKKKTYAELQLALRNALEQRNAFEAAAREVEELRSRCHCLEDACEMWQDAALRVEDGEASHRSLGLTKDGAVLVIATADEAAADPLYGAA